MPITILKGCRQCGEDFEAVRADQKFCGKKCARKSRYLRRQLDESAKARDYYNRWKAKPEGAPPPKRVKMFPDWLALRCMIAHPSLPEAKALRDRLLPVVIPQPVQVEEKRRFTPEPLHTQIKVVADGIVFPRNPIRVIQDLVAQRFNLSLDSLLARRRTHEYVIPRQVAMYLCCHLAKHKSLPEIGRRFGGYDHTTVINARQAITRRMEKDAELAATVADLRTAIETQ